LPLVWRRARRGVHSDRAEPGERLYFVRRADVIELDMNVDDAPHIISMEWSRPAETAETRPAPLRMRPARAVNQ
jgi:hypothetical protein